ncbi:carbohydrate-binding module family 14 protein [Streptomyces sp. NPDC048659]|uniref:carbohydrate-binding module family 14 protein n=1 Tax=Streptomyces sp. NPDC048659 TaxID=3155489 RepID=UPI003446B99D
MSPTKATVKGTAMRAAVNRMIGTMAMGASAVLAVSGTAWSAPASASSAEAGNSVGVCVAGTGLFAHPDEPHLFVHCEGSAPYIKECPPGMEFNRSLTTCDWPDSADADPTGVVVTARPASLSLLPLQVKNLSAKAQYDDVIYAGTFRFTTTSGTVLCTATTDAEGVATCDSKPGLLAPAASLLLGYKAEFTPNTSTVKPRTGTGAVNPL